MCTKNAVFALFLCYFCRRVSDTSACLQCSTCPTVVKRSITTSCGRTGNRIYYHFSPSSAIVSSTCSTGRNHVILGEVGFDVKEQNLYGAGQKKFIVHVLLQFYGTGRKYKHCTFLSVFHCNSEVPHPISSKCTSVLPYTLNCNRPQCMKLLKTFLFST